MYGRDITDTSPTRGKTRMKYIVTGGAGFIGSHLGEYLVSQDHEVVIIDDLSSGSERNVEFLKKQKGCRFVRGSVTDSRLLQKYFAGADGIFHHAALVSVPLSVKNPELNHETNSTGTLRVLLAARDCGVRKVVLASSAAVYGDKNAPPQKETMKPEPQSPYAVSKLTGEEYCSVFSQEYGLDTVCLRYFNVYGPRQNPGSDYAAVIPRFIVQNLKGLAPTIFGDGMQSRDFVYVEDVVRANVCAMQRDVQGVFNIAGGKSITINELAGAIRDIVGNDKCPVYTDPRPGDIKESFADISKAKEQMHFTPEYSLAAGLQKTISWYKENS
jgi:UDP-glucose 4-epimerase